MMEPMLAQIREIVAGSASFEEARARLMDAYGAMDDSALTEALARSFFCADAFGRATALEQQA